jgi:NADPH:quinone reductase-like Zn-dependent oxidoreductase
MKAAIYERYGPPEVLEIREVAKPIPKANEVLIRVCATTVTATDCLMRRGEPRWSRLILGFGKPRKKILGIELSGVVEAVGRNVRRFQPGDPVFGAAMINMACCAEYVCLPEKAGLALKPAALTYEEAAAFPDGALTALTFLRDIGKIQAGQHVLIYGASGSVGSFAVQLAKHFGAHVTGVCSTANVAMVKSLGAARVIDYTQQDFTGESETYDLVFDAVGKTTFSHCKTALKPGGVFLACGMTEFLWPVMPQMLWTALTGGKKVKTGSSNARPEHLNFLKELVEAGELKSAIDRVYPLGQIVEAHRYVETGHKRGNVVITVSAESGR